MIQSTSRQYLWQCVAGWRVWQGAVGIHAATPTEGRAAHTQLLLRLGCCLLFLFSHIQNLRTFFLREVYNRQVT